MSPKHVVTSSPLAKQAAWLQQYHFGLRIAEQGRVVSFGDGIVWITGLPSAAMDDIVVLEDGSEALVFRLGEPLLGAILLRQTAALASGTVVHRAGQRLSLPVGDALLGRIIDPLGTPLDGLPPPECHGRHDLDVPSPPIVARDFVHEPLYTGNKMIDTLIPIGKGQRQLIIGDDGVGKSALALDTVLNQRDKDVYCVYVLIGQRRSSVVSTIETLRSVEALPYTTVVVAEASSLPGLKYLAPFAGCAVAEAWMAQGKHTLIVYDDLTMHAQAYRELSLLLRRAPGREAYPGDIFFLHARLLERATCLAPAFGGGSMTALPIVATQQGEIAAYIPTNLISITDGQVYLDQRLFAAGILPAIDVTKSVSRIGGKAQHPRIKREAGRMKLDYLQFLELEVFTRFGTRLEASMEAKITRGRVLRALFKQEKRAPLPPELHMAWLVALNAGLFDTVDVEDIPKHLDRLAAGINASELRIEDNHEQWVQAVTAWLRDHA